MDDVTTGASPAPETITVPQRHALRTVLIDGVPVEWPEGAEMPSASAEDAAARQRDGQTVVAKGPAAHPADNPTKQASSSSPTPDSATGEAAVATGPADPDNTLDPAEQE